MYVLKCITLDWDGKIQAGFGHHDSEWFSHASRDVPADYELPEWVQHRLMALSIVELKSTSNYVEGVGRADRLGPKRRYAVFVPPEHADMWSELV